MKFYPEIPLKYVISVYANCIAFVPIPIDNKASYFPRILVRREL